MTGVCELCRCEIDVGYGHSRSGTALCKIRDTLLYPDLNLCR